jgi:transposase
MMKNGLSISDRAQHHWRTTMDEYIGLDVSTKETAISVPRDGKRIWRGKCASEPELIAQVIRKRAQRAKRVVFETGPLSVWFFHALTDEGMPAICIDARHAKASLDMPANKTDANDADGLRNVSTIVRQPGREIKLSSFGPWPVG